MNEMVAGIVLDLFKVIVVEKKQLKTRFNIDNFENGFVTDFTPNTNQVLFLQKHFQPLNVKTLFSVQERKESDPYALIVKQLLHYIEVYGLDTPGLFNLEVDGGVLIGMVNVKGVTVETLGDMVRKLIYAPNPIKKTLEIKQIIDEYKIDFDINLVKNNEMRIILFKPDSDKFNNGDDVVRYLCYLATGDSMLIKSKDVLEQIKNFSLISRDKMNSFLENHMVPLSEVFNRHKNIIINMKNDYNRHLINKIARMSKKNHVPIKTAINKTFISQALTGAFDNKLLDNAELFSLRDKFKYLNLLEYKIKKNDMDAFIIRNGKVHLEKNRPKYDLKEIDILKKNVLNSLKKDLKHLSKEKILLDEFVDYGLPVSRKQTMGNLPFGTTVSIPDEEDTISSGIYWHNDGGATDLDLSAIDESGGRTGWGAYSGYARKNDIVFSGDVTNARSGAMEFMTSYKGNKQTYGLFVNIFRGEIGSKAEIVVGYEKKNRWIEKPILKEKIELLSNGNIIGFVKDGKFVVWNLRCSRAIISSPKNKALLSRATSEFWTVKKLFDALNIKYDVKKSPKTKYSFEMNYENFSLDKLEGLLYK